MTRLHIIGVSVLLLAAASCAPRRAPEPSSKLDRALNEWIAHPTATVRVLIRTRGGKLVAATVDASALRAMNGDPDVERVSSDALVRSLGTSYLTQDVLLNTEALLPRQYSGANIGVAIVDSGILPNANEKVAATYEFTGGRNGVKVGALDPFGHGTHVAGLIGSNGTTSTDLYEGIAPGVKFFALHALGPDGSGYTSDVINAINFAVANKSKLEHRHHQPVARPSDLRAGRHRSAGAGRRKRRRARVSSWWRPRATSAATRARTSPATPASRRQATRRRRSRSARSTRSRPRRATTTWSRRTARAARRGTTAFQKPDLVAPGHRIVSDVAERSSADHETYPAD